MQDLLQAPNTVTDGNIQAEMGLDLLCPVFAFNHTKSIASTTYFPGSGQVGRLIHGPKKETALVLPISIISNYSSAGQD